MEDKTVSSYLEDSRLSPSYFKNVLRELEENGETLCNQLKERVVTLKISINSLKTNVQNEKEAWKNEVIETKKLEKDLQQNSWKGYLPPGDYNQQLDMLTNAVLKSQIITQSQQRNDMEMEVFKQKLLEAEDLCNAEMLKIKQSLESLKPLQVMVKKWNLPNEETKPTTEVSVLFDSCDQKDGIVQVWNTAKTEHCLSESEKDSGISCDEKVENVF